MLTITVPDGEFWDEKNQEFINVKEQVLQLEHSLVSISKWESKWHKPFLNEKSKTDAEIIDYVRCMTLTQNVDINVYRNLTLDNIRQINLYINDSMTATTFSNNNQSKSKRLIITSELIYYWMISLNIPMECQKWHLSRLLTLIRVCNEKNNPKKKSRAETLKEYARINKERRNAALRNKK